MITLVCVAFFSVAFNSPGETGVATGSPERTASSGFDGAGFREALALVAPGLVWVDDLPACKHCVRTPEPVLQNPPSQTDFALGRTQEGNVVPFTLVSAVFRFPAYDHGRDGTCSYGGCSPEGCVWKGEVRVQVATSNPAQSFDLEVTWNGMQLGTKKMTSGDSPWALPVEESLPCEEVTNQVPLTITDTSTGIEIFKHYFVCNPCR